MSSVASDFKSHVTMVDGCPHVLSEAGAQSLVMFLGRGALRIRYL